MVTYEQESDVFRWGLRLFDGDPSFCACGYYGNAAQASDGYHVQYASDRYDISDSSHVENDEIIARTLQEEYSQLAVSEATAYSDTTGEEHLQAPVHSNDGHYESSRNEYSDDDHSHEESDDVVPSSSCYSPVNGDEYSYSPEYTDEHELDEVGKRLSQMILIPHVPRINGEIPSIDEATSDHERLMNRLQLFGFVEVKVQGDGNCQFRALSDQLYNTPDHHKIVRQQIVNQLKSNPDIYEGYVPMEYDEYLQKMSKSGEWGDHVTLQAAADAYGVKILVITSFKDTCYIEILPVMQKSKGVIFLSFWAEVHYNSIYFQGGTTSGEFGKKKKWWSFGNKH